MTISNETPSQCWRCKTSKESDWAYCPKCGLRLVGQRNPSQPNSAIDIPFLYDIYSSGWYNHHVAAVALYDAAGSINRFYDSRVQEDYRLVVEPGRAQQILRAKIYAEFIALLEAFGVLCLTIAKHEQQSLMWTYLNTEPQEVTQFYERVLSFDKPP